MVIARILDRLDVFGLLGFLIMAKLRTALGKFGEFWVHIAYFWPAWVGHNYFVNRKFSKLSKEISDSKYVT